MADHPDPAKAAFEAQIDAFVALYFEQTVSLLDIPVIAASWRDISTIHALMHDGVLDINQAANEMQAIVDATHRTLIAQKILFDVVLAAPSSQATN
jgi:hypothetical protein